jgi:hypothetical protein
MNKRPYEPLIRQIVGEPVPVDLGMITSRDLVKARQLELDFAHTITSSQPAGLPPLNGL